MSYQELTPSKAKTKIQEPGRVIMPVDGLCSSNIEVVKEDAKALLDDLSSDYVRVLYSKNDQGNHWISIKEK